MPLNARSESTTLESSACDAPASAALRRAPTNSAFRLIEGSVSADPATELPFSSVMWGSGRLSPQWEGRTARLAVRRLESSVAVIIAHGDIDASNAGTLAEYVLGYMPHCRGLIVDLHDLNFCGIDGFSALRRISSDCARVPMDWAVVPGTAVARVLRICDPQRSLPAVDTVDVALATIQDQPRHLPQFGRQ
jgi:anti-anti-sigma factor